jgi:hypothetical protein
MLNLPVKPGNVEWIWRGKTSAVSPGSNSSAKDPARSSGGASLLFDRVEIQTNRRKIRDLGGLFDFFTILSTN